MPLEKELKYLDADHDKMRHKLENSEAEYVGIWFEENIVFDDESRSLREQLLLLRLRRKGSKYVVTVKKPPQEGGSGKLKVYEEYEVNVSDFEQTKQIFAVLGYTPAFRYEKVREKWLLNGVEICLDLLPFGMFAELEGEEENVFAVADLLELKESCTENYHTLNRNWRKSEGLTPDDNFIFDKQQKITLLNELAES